MARPASGGEMNLLIRKLITLSTFAVSFRCVHVTEDAPAFSTKGRIIIIINSIMSDHLITRNTQHILSN